MLTLKQKAEDFLAQKHIAVVGVSRTRQNAANTIYRKLRESGYQVFPVNPHAERVEDDTCYPNLAAIPEQIDGVVVATRPEVTEAVVSQCADAGISRVWMHHSLAFMGSSVSEKAVQFCQQNNIMVIPGGCPMMFCEPVDFAHKCMHWMASVTGNLPK